MKYISVLGLVSAQLGYSCDFASEGWYTSQVDVQDDFTCWETCESSVKGNLEYDICCNEIVSKDSSICILNYIDAYLGDIRVPAVKKLDTLEYSWAWNDGV